MLPHDISNYYIWVYCCSCGFRFHSILCHRIFFSIPALMSHCFNNLGLARDTIFGPYNRSRVSRLQCPSCGWTARPPSLGQTGDICPSVLWSPAKFSRPQIPAVWENSALALGLYVPPNWCFLSEMSSIWTHPAHVHGWGVILRVWSTPESISTLAASSHLK